MTQYPTDLTEKQWQVIKNILEPQARNRKHPLKEIMNAILYINKTGCQWRMLPSDLAPWQTVYYYFRKWKLEGVFEEVMDALHSLIRKQAGREESPSLGIMDSRSVKTSIMLILTVYRREQENQRTERAHHCRYAWPSVSRRNP